MSRPRRSRHLLVIAALFVGLDAPGAQIPVSEADLASAGTGRPIAIGQLSSGRVTRMPLETYVSRVLAGEAEREAPEGELQALAIAIRTYALFNAGRHGRDGFDLCDATHCQVLRASTPATRQAALDTAGQILTWQGRPAELFYSASCGGRSERAAAVWPAANLPYLTSVRDDVHEDDEPWTFETTLDDVRRALAGRGVGGARLRDVKVAARTSSERVARVRLVGLAPEEMTGDQFRLALGARDIRSTAFEIDRDGSRLTFTGRGYGHGVGMCVVGAGRRARRGESVRQILAHYYPGLDLSPLNGTSVRRPAASDPRPRPTVAIPAPAPATAPRPTAPVIRPGRPSAIAAQGAVPPDVRDAADAAYQAMSTALGTAVAPIALSVYDSLEAFRTATGKPWWVSASTSANAIALAPPSLLSQRDGLEQTLRIATADVLVSPALADRPAWVRVGAARYFARLTPASPPPANARLRCPTDNELTLAVSAPAQREAESRAEQCFARAYARTGDWRTVR